MKKLEQTVELSHQRLSQLEIKLSDLSLYENNQQNKLQILLEEQKKLQQELKQIEEEWLEVAQTLEQHE